MKDIGDPNRLESSVNQEGEGDKNPIIPGTKQPILCWDLAAPGGRLRGINLRELSGKLTECVPA